MDEIRKHQLTEEQLKDFQRTYKKKSIVKSILEETIDHLIERLAEEQTNYWDDLYTIVGANSKEHHIDLNLRTGVVIVRKYDGD